MEAFDDFSLPLSPWQHRIQGLLHTYRAIARETIESLMQEAFEEIGRILEGEDGEPAPELPVNKPLHGLSPATLAQISQHHSLFDLADWLAEGADGQMPRLLSEFLELDRLRREDFRRRFPRAFHKWTPEEDAWLLKEYEMASSLAGRIPWDDLADRCHRNPNALKLRLERLGVALRPEDSGRARYPHPPTGPTRP